MWATIVGYVTKKAQLFKWILIGVTAVLILLGGYHLKTLVTDAHRAAELTAGIEASQKKIDADHKADVKYETKQTLIDNKNEKATEQAEQNIKSHPSKQRISDEQLREINAAVSRR